MKVINNCNKCIVISGPRDLSIYLYTSPNLSAVIICDPSLLKAIAMARLGTDLPYNKTN